MSEDSGANSKMKMGKVFKTSQNRKIDKALGEEGVEEYARTDLQRPVF